jgi:hypothetical protein
MRRRVSLLVFEKPQLHLTMSIPVAVVLFAGLVGCKTPPATTDTAAAFSYYRAGEASPPVRRVVLLPLFNETPHRDAEELIRQALAEQLRSAGPFEVVTPDQLQLRGFPPLCRSLADVDERLLLEARERFQADAVLIGSLRHYHPYWPPRIGVTLHLVETTEAMTVASVDGMWDAANESVAKQARGHLANLTPKRTIPESELILHSPRYFSRFVSYQVTKALGGDSVQVAPEHVHSYHVPSAKHNAPLFPPPHDN